MQRSVRNAQNFQLSRYPSRISSVELVQLSMSNEAEDVSVSSTVSSTKISKFFNAMLAVFAGFALIMVVGGENPMYALSLQGKTYPVLGSDEIMASKEHGTSSKGVQAKLRWNVDVNLADRITNYNRRFAEFAGYWSQDTSFLKEVDTANPTKFYDSVTGKLLFTAPLGRSFEDFKDESLVHGWPSFRDNEVNWENVRSLKNGEIVSLTGTHLGHNIPDSKGNRYCINIVSIAGFPESDQGGDNK